MLPDSDAVASVELEYHPLKTLAARLRGGNGIQNQGLRPAPTCGPVIKHEVR
jgi:hypothetical protein